MMVDPISTTRSKEPSGLGKGKRYGLEGLEVELLRQGFMPLKLALDFMCLRLASNS